MSMTVEEAKSVYRKQSSHKMADYLEAGEVLLDALEASERRVRELEAEPSAKGWRANQWVMGDVDMSDPGNEIVIDRMLSPFYEGTRYAVRRIGRCLNTSGRWEREPIPSSRTDAFYERCRFRSFDEAVRAAEAALAAREAQQ